MAQTAADVFVIIEAAVDPLVPRLPAKIKFEQAKNLPRRSPVVSRIARGSPGRRFLKKCGS